jgi:putative addiction module component (TIGR02574 family)
MNPQNQAVFDAALALPEEERALLAERLLETLSPETNDQTDDELAAELDRRFAEYQRDPSVAVPWSEIKRQG